MHFILGYIISKLFQGLFEHRSNRLKKKNLLMGYEYYLSKLWFLT